MVKTIACTPTWAALMPGIIAALQNGSSTGEQIAKEELTKLAKAVDAMNERNKQPDLLREAATAIVHQRDYFAEHSAYDETTFHPDYSETGQCFDDWAADILEAALGQ